MYKHWEVTTSCFTIIRGFPCSVGESNKALYTFHWPTSKGLQLILSNMTPYNYYRLLSCVYTVLHYNMLESFSQIIFPFVVFHSFSFNFHLSTEGVCDCVLSESCDVLTGLRFRLVANSSLAPLTNLNMKYINCLIDQGRTHLNIPMVMCNIDLPLNFWEPHHYNVIIIMRMYWMFILLQC